MRKKIIRVKRILYLDNWNIPKNINNDNAYNYSLERVDCFRNC